MWAKNQDENDGKMQTTCDLEKLLNLSASKWGQRTTCQFIILLVFHCMLVVLCWLEVAGTKVLDDLIFAGEPY